MISYDDDEEDVREALRLSLIESEAGGILNGETQAPSRQCPICMCDMNFSCIGDKCNHVVCSQCHFRLRLKLNQRGCQICRQESSNFVVSASLNQEDESQPHKTFIDFSVWIGRSGEGVIYDERFAAHFYRCPEHYSHMALLASTHCRICQTSFRDVSKLKIHLKMAHKLYMCQLCIENRPVFISEQSLFTAEELKRHTRGQRLLGRDDGLRDCDDINAVLHGHPRCDFCQEAFFDTAALHGHMVSEHFMCFFCQNERPVYFQNYAALENHVATAHFMCDICVNQQGNAIRGAMPGFSTLSDLDEHMAQEHGIVGQHRTVGLLSQGLGSQAGSVAEDRGTRTSSTSSTSRALVRAPSEADLASEGLFPSLAEDAGRRGGTDTPPLTSGSASSHPSSSSSSSSFVASSMRPTSPLLPLSQPSNASQTSDSGVTSAKKERRRHRSSGANVASLSSSMAAIGRGVICAPLRRPTAQVDGRRDFVAQLLSGIDGVVEWTCTSSALLAARRRADVVLECLARCRVVCPAQPILGAGRSPSGPSGASSSNGQRGRDVLFDPCYSASLVEWAAGSPERRQKLRELERRVQAFVNDAPRKSAELKPMPSEVRKAGHQTAFYHMVGSRSFGYDERRHIVFSKRFGSRHLEIECLSSMPLSRFESPFSPTFFSGGKVLYGAEPEPEAEAEAKACGKGPSTWPPQVAVSHFPPDFTVAHLLELMVSTHRRSTRKGDADNGAGEDDGRHDDVDSNADVDGNILQPVGILSTGLCVTLAFASASEAWAAMSALEPPFPLRPREGVMSRVLAPSSEQWSLHVAAKDFDVSGFRLSSRPTADAAIAVLQNAQRATTIMLDKERETCLDNNGDGKVDVKVKECAQSSCRSTSGRSWWPEWDPNLWSETAREQAELQAQEEAERRDLLDRTVRMIQETRDETLIRNRLALRPVHSAFENFNTSS